MISKETISELIERIKKATNLTQEEIADRIGYERPYLSQAKKSGSDKLKKALLNEFKSELENLTTNRDDHIDDLRDRIQELKDDKAYFKLQCEERIKKIEANLESVLDNQRKLKTELAVAFRLVVQQLVGADNGDKLEEISNEFDTLLTAALH